MPLLDGDGQHQFRHDPRLTELGQADDVTSGSSVSASASGDMVLLVLGTDTLLTVEKTMTVMKPIYDL